MAYFSETAKAREIIDPKYFDGKVVDIGCGSEKIKESAIGVDGRDLDSVDFKLTMEDEIYNLSFFHNEKLGGCDTLFSSHLLEHIGDDYLAICDWCGLIKKDGYLVLYLPDGNLYSHEGNLEHMRPYTYDSFMFWFERVFCGVGKNYKGENLKPKFELIESGIDNRPDCYSFYVIAQKL